MGFKVGDINHHQGSHRVHCIGRGFSSNGSIEKFQIFALPQLHGCLHPCCLHRSYLKSCSEGPSGGFIHIYCTSQRPSRSEHLKELIDTYATYPSNGSLPCRQSCMLPSVRPSPRTAAADLCNRQHNWQPWERRVTQNIREQNPTRTYLLINTLGPISMIRPQHLCGPMWHCHIFIFTLFYVARPRCLDPHWCSMIAAWQV